MLHRSLTVLSIALFALSGAARGADVSSYTSSSAVGYWQGGYAGVNAGFQGGRADNLGTKPSGVAGGIQAGYNVQHSQFVFGGETDLQLSASDDNFAAWKFSNPWFGTLRARAGFAVNTVLFYGTVGLAYGSVKLENNLTTVTESHLTAGWTAGVGAEFSPTRNWSLRGEYLYVDLSDRPFMLSGANHGLQSSLFRLGVNYRF